MSFPVGSAEQPALTSGNPRNNGTYYLTFFLFLLTAFLFIRSVLPRIPRLFLRGRLRVRRIGLRGVRGIHWRSNGHAQGGTRHRQPSQKSVQPPSLVVKVEHAYLDLNLWGRSSSRAPAVDDAASQDASAPRKSWVTIHIQGVGIRLPRGPDHDDEQAQQQLQEKARRQAEEEDRIQRETQETADRRLEDLIKGSAATSYSGFRRPSLMSRENSDQGNAASDKQPSPCHQPSPKSASFADLLRCRLIPALRRSVLVTIRAALFVITSSLPVLTSLIDVEVSRLEVYIEDAESVVRIERAGLELSMALVSGRHTGLKTAQAACMASQQRRASSTWRSMPTKLGYSARDAVGFVTAGLPAGRAGLLFDVQGVQIFEADHTACQRQGTTDTSGAGVRSSRKWLRGHGRDSSARRPGASSRSRRWANKCIDFADFGLEPSPSSGFSADTEWLTEHSDADAIPAAACLLEIQRRSTLEVGLLLGPSLRLGVKEAIELHVSLGGIDIGLDAIYRVVRVLEERKALRSGPAPTVDGASGGRSGLSKHVAQQRKDPAAKALASIRALSLGLPSISVRSHTALSDCPFAESLTNDERARLPRVIQLDATVKGITFSLSTSNPQDDLHKRWLGTCGLKSHKSSAAALRSRSPSSQRNVRSTKATQNEAVEHRRAFQVEGGFKSVDVSCVVNDQRVPSRLLHLGQLSIHTRSTWTPFGLFPLAEESKDQPRKYFVSDPNEQVLFADVTLAKIRGDLKLDCASSIMSFVQMRAAERRSLRKTLHIDQPPKKDRLQLLDHVPKLALGFEVNDVLYRIDSGGAPENALSGVKAGQHESSLILRLPRLSFNFQGSYRDAFIKRSDAERRAAWKAFNSDELEWSLFDETCVPASVFSSPKMPRTQTFSAFVDRFKGQLSPGARPTSPSDQRDSRSPSPTGQTYFSSRSPRSMSPMRLDEPDDAGGFRAAERKATTAENDERDDQVDVRCSFGNSKSTRVVRVPTRVTRRASSASRADCAVWYDLETNLACPNFEGFFVFSGRDPSVQAPQSAGNPRQRDQEGPDSSHSGKGDAACNMTTQDSSADHLTRRQLFAMNNIDVGIESAIPGTQDPAESHAALRVSQHQSKIKGLLEEIDVELWHPRVLQVLSETIAVFEKAKQPFGAKNAATPSPRTSQPSPTQTSLIDNFPGNFELWLSIGGVLAHVGGSDPMCDPFLSRGVGLEARRIVAEIVSASGKVEQKPHERSDWGARSALTLAEDVKVSAQALAARHSRAAVAKLSLYELGIFPLLDIEQASQLVDEDLGGPAKKSGRTQSANNDARADSLFADAIWDFQHRQPALETHARRRYHQEDRASNFITWLPYSAFKASIFPPEVESTKSLNGKPMSELMLESEGTELLTIKIQLLHSYCFLVAIAALRRLMSRASAPKNHGAQSGEANQQRNKDETAPEKATQASRAASKRASMFLNLGISDIHVYIDLPEEVRLFVHIRRLDIKVSDQDGAAIAFESLMGAVESPRMLATDLWEEAARLRDWKITIPKKVNPSGRSRISVCGDAASLRVPYGYVVHNIIDSASVAFKATKQLVHQLGKGCEDSIITPVGEDPKHLPYVNICIRILTIEAQDDPIETRLNIIWRAGRDENRARLERAEAFEAKAQALVKEPENLNTSQTSLSSTSASVRSSSLSWNSSESSDNDSDDDGSIVSDRGFSLPSPRSPIDVEAWCQKARNELAAYDSSSWIRRYANARAEQSRKEDAILNQIFGRSSAYRHPVDLPIEMAQPTRAAPLFRSTMSGLDISVGPPSFVEDELRNWLHEQGNGTPKDLPYSLLVPFNIDWKMSEWKWELRDYPLPLLHFPPKESGGQQSKSQYAFRLKSDLCIAEHLSESGQSIRHVPAVVVPAACGHPDSREYGINVPKVAMPVKIYGSPVIELDSSWPTRVCWGQSIQPAIADMVRVFDGITSPPHDPSPKIGFWDKIPLIFHSKWLLKWKGDSELHIHLKGSRDPYYIHGNGAGWVKCWRGDVEIRLGWENEDREFFQVISDEYLLAIPDLRGYQDRAATGVQCPSASVTEEDVGSSINGSSMRASHFTKVCLRLANGVRWGASLQHEHTCREGLCERSQPCKGDNFYRECRFFDRIPHWKVIQRSREFMDTLPESERTDSFYGWRSDFSHLGISIYSPKNGLTAYGKHRSQSEGSNNLYFSPLAWQHFWAWMRLFDSAMALPIRQGQLFPNGPPPSPKFGRHLGTIKYRFDIAPLFISHLYAQFSRADWARGVSTMLGIKARLDTFHIDMHQRQQEMIKEKPELKEAKKVFHKPFYEAEADFAGIDLRTLVGRFRDSSKQLMEFDDLDAEADENVNFLGGENPGEEDSSWVDIDDFVEVDYTPSVEETPDIRLIQALTCPHFNFYRRYDSQREREAKNQNRPEEGREEVVGLEKTKFGNEREHTHTCLIGKGPSPGKVQHMLAQQRLGELTEQLEKFRGGAADGSSKTDEQDDLRKRIKLVQQHIDLIVARDDDAHTEGRKAGEGQHRSTDAKDLQSKNHADGAANISELLADWETFDDRFLIHNPTFFFSNQTRLILLRYYASSKRRKSIIHHMTARAIWNIRQLNKQGKEGSARPAASRRPTQASQAGSELLTGLLTDTMQYVMADPDVGPEAGTADAFLDTHIDPSEGIGSEFKVRRSNICAFVKPQFVLTSQIDDASSVVITAVRMRLRNFAVMDPSVSDDDALNGRVLSRNYFTLDGLQTFHPTPATVNRIQKNRRAGCAISVPLETLVDMRQETQDFARIVSRTDASIRYDKFNRLRLHDSSRPVYADAQGIDASTDHLRHYMDLLRVRCPRFAVSANSAHFGALYNIVTDLILYRDPAWREHAKQLETTLLSHDFKDVNALAEAVADLQLRIRRILECDEEYQFHFDDLNERGRQEFFYLKAEMADVAQELLLLAEAITASEDSKGDDEKDKKSALRMEAHSQDLSWNMMGENDGELLAKLSIKRPSFTWLNKADNSAANSLSIVDLNAVDVRPDAHFAEIISKWGKAPDHPMAKQGRFVNAVWSELAPVGGISIVDQFELDLHPLKLQLEMKVGKMIMDYVFGSKRHREKEERKRKEILDAQIHHAKSKSKTTPFARLTSSSKSGEAGNGSAAASEASSRRTSTSSELRSSKSRSMLSDGSRQKVESSRPASIRGGSASDEEESDDYSQLAIAKRNAAQMRKRSSSNLTFVFFKLPETVFCLSYKGDKDKSITDVYDLVFRAPNIEYRNRTWGYEELVQHMKRDIFRAAWGQKTTILKSILSHRPRRPEALRNIREKQALLRKTSREHRGLSPLQLHVHPPSPTGSRGIGTELSAGYEEGLANGASLVELSSEDEGEDETLESRSADALSLTRAESGTGASQRLSKPSRESLSLSQTATNSRLGRFLHDKLGSAGGGNGVHGRQSGSPSKKGGGGGGGGASDDGRNSSVGRSHLEAEAARSPRPDDVSSSTSERSSL